MPKEKIFARVLKGGPPAAGALIIRVEPERGGGGLVGDRLISTVAILHISAAGSVAGRPAC